MAVKLYYFDIRGLGEPIRWILHYGEIEFEDIRIPLDKFPPTLPEEIKSRTPFGQVPLVEIGDKKLVQSTAIYRYFANKVGLVPEDPFQAALCDEYVDAIRDFFRGFAPVAAAQDAKEKEEKLQEAAKINKAKYLDVFESILKENGGKYLVGSSITWADIIMASAMDHFENTLGVDITEGYENIRNLRDSIMNLPKIRAWLDKRPKTAR